MRVHFSLVATDFSTNQKAQTRCLTARQAKLGEINHKCLITLVCINSILLITAWNKLEEQTCPSHQFHNTNQWPMYYYFITFMPPSSFIQVNNYICIAQSLLLLIQWHYLRCIPHLRPILPVQMITLLDVARKRYVTLHVQMNTTLNISLTCRIHWTH